MKPSGLRQRLTLSILGYTVLLSAAVVLHGYIVNERAEHIVWESLLASEFAHIEQRYASSHDFRWVDTEKMQLYGALNDTRIPAEFAKLAAGVHDEVDRAGGQFVLWVSGAGDQTTVLALEISAMEQSERALTWTMALSSAGLVLLLAAVTYIGTGRLVRPLVLVAKEIAALSPGQRGQRIETPPSAPQEAIVVVDAVNEHLRRKDEFMERELAFVRMTSHELRTPMAVIASTAEVALDAHNPDTSPELALRRILLRARDVETLLALLLTLAKDPARLRDVTESVDIAQLVPLIIQDHQFLAQHKSLVFDVNLSSLVLVRAPIQIVRAAIGNLIRNAIENSDSGTIEVSTSNESRIVIRDPGRGMSEEQLSRLYSQLARGAGSNAGGGIGLDLIHRVCEHLGWRLVLSSRPSSGTTVTLDFITRT